MDHLLEHLRSEFALCDVSLAEADFLARRAGQVCGKGWSVWYCFGKDERGDYVDTYSSHRMTSDRHLRVYTDGNSIDLPALRCGRKGSEDPAEDARLEAAFRTESAEIESMLVRKGFGLSGVEPGGVAINRYLRTRSF